MDARRRRVAVNAVRDIEQRRENGGAEAEHPGGAEPLVEIATFGRFEDARIRDRRIHRLAPAISGDGPGLIVRCDSKVTGRRPAPCARQTQIS